MSILRLININKKFKSGSDELIILDKINFELNEGESVALLAPSGAGKTTFLQIAATLDSPTNGEIFINNKLVSTLSDNAKSKLRLIYLGFIYQFHNLLPDFTALENIMIPMLINKINKQVAKEKSEFLLNSVNLYNRRNHFPNQLSGGEQQRVAIARALANDPKIIFADEPTGNLDPTTAIHVFDLFLTLIQTSKISLVMATHNLNLGNLLNKKLTIKNGKLCSYI